MVNTAEIDEFKADLAQEARRLGFATCGVTASGEDPVRAQRLHEWLDEGRHGEMDWMEARAHHRRSPQGLWDEAQSVIALGMSYAPQTDPLALEAHPDRARISVYAQGQDYHDVVKKALKALARWIVDQSPSELKVFVDTAPVMEKPLAGEAGLGWQGKHSNLVSRSHGSWLFLGAIYTTLELPADPPAQDRCGSCTACQTACPTEAITLVFGTEKRGIDIPNISPDFETNVPGIFAAGDVTTTPYKQIIIAMGEGSKAALSAFDYLIRLPAAQDQALAA